MSASNSTIINAFYSKALPKPTVTRQLQHYTDDNLTTEVKIPHIGNVHVLSYVVRRYKNIRKALQFFTYLLNLDINLLVNPLHIQTLLEDMCSMDKYNNYIRKSFLETYFTSRHFDPDIFKTPTISLNGSSILPWDFVDRNYYKLTADELIILVHAGYVSDPTLEQKNDTKLINLLVQQKSMLETYARTYLHAHVEIITELNAILKRLTTQNGSNS